MIADMAADSTQTLTRQFVLDSRDRAGEPTEAPESLPPSIRPSQADLKVFPNGKVMKVQKSRQRRILSCVYCHSKKIKCSRQQPICNNCDKLGLDCKYFVNQRVSRGGKKSSRLEEAATKHTHSSNSSSTNSPPAPAKQPVSVADFSDDMDMAAEMSHDGFLGSHVSQSVKLEEGTSPISSASPCSRSNSHNADAMGSGLPMIRDDLSSNPSDLPGLFSSDQSGQQLSGTLDLGSQHIQLNSQLLNEGQNGQNIQSRQNGLQNGHQNGQNDLNGLQNGQNGQNVLQNGLNGLNNLQNSHQNGQNSHNNLQNSENNHNSQIAGNRAVFSVQTPPLTFNSTVGSYFGNNYSAKFYPSKEDDSYSFNSSSFTIAQPNPLNSQQNGTFKSSLGNGTPNGNANAGSNISSLMNFPSSHSNSSSNISAFFTRNINNLFSTAPGVDPLDSPQQGSKNRAIPIGQNDLNQSNLSQANLNQSNLNSSSTFSSSQQDPLHSINPPVNPLMNSLNPFKSSPATSVNYLYGTNSYYANENLLEDLVKHLPKSKEKSFELINRYVNSVHILLPILINLPEFLKEHERYWELNEKKNAEAQRMNVSNSKFQSVSSDSSTPPTTASDHSSTSSSANRPVNDDDFNYLQFHTLYFPVLYAATISEFEEYDNLLLNQDIDRYLKAFNKICQYHNYPHGLKTIPILLGNVIIQSTSPNPSTMEMSLIIRYAKFLQLHKDPANTLHIKNWEVIKFRRLLWWDIFGLDALTCHNFCLPPVCRFDDFNVLMPDEEEPVFNDAGEKVGTTLNVSILSMNVKFKYDAILSELVYHLNNGISTNITSAQIKEIKSMINDLFLYIQEAIRKLNEFFKLNPPSTVQEMNLINFIKNHSWSFVDRALMLLHRKILMSEGSVNVDVDRSLSNPAAVAAAATVAATRYAEPKDGALSLSEYEDTFGFIQEANIIKNFDKCSISQLKFNQHEDFSYDNLHNNLIPSILHNLNDFLKYNDFIKFGKYNWYIKRTIPIDSIILMFIIITIKFKYEIMLMDELCIYVKLINKAMFILNRKWFKNEKYKRMLTITSSTWEFILKRYNVISLINKYRDSNNPNNGRIEFYDYQLTGYMSMNDLFNVMDVPQPILMEGQKHLHPKSESAGGVVSKLVSSSGEYFDNSLVSCNGDSNQKSNELAISSIQMTLDTKAELLQLNEKIYYDLRNNFVDINDCCAFYTSLEHILHELMDYIHRT